MCVPWLVLRCVVSIKMYANKIISFAKKKKTHLTKHPASKIERRNAMVACHRLWLIFIIPWKLHAATRVATCGREKRQPSARTWHAFYFNSIFSTLTDCDFSPATWYVRALFSSPPHPRKRISQIATAGVAVFRVRIHNCGDNTCSVRLWFTTWMQSVDIE